MYVGTGTGAAQALTIETLNLVVIEVVLGSDASATGYGSSPTAGGYGTPAYQEGWGTQPISERTDGIAATLQTVGGHG